MRVKCYSVLLESLVSISDKAFKAVCFDGSTDIIPKSQVFGQDMDVTKSEAWWISAWILEKKNIQYSCKKVAMFDSESSKMIPTIFVERHKPDKFSPVDDNSIESLRNELAGSSK